MTASELVCDPATHDEMEQDEDGWHVIVICCGGGCGKRANADEFIRDEGGARYCAECWRALSEDAVADAERARNDAIEEREANALDRAIDQRCEEALDRARGIE